MRRLKSWAVWASVLGALGIIFNATGIFDSIGMTNETFQAVITAVGSILVAFGILNNPTDKEKF